MNEKDRLENFRAMVKSRLNTTHLFEETDGRLRDWKDLSPSGKLEYICLDAIRCDVPFEPFSETVRTTIADAPDAALRLLHSAQRELHELEKMLPDPNGTESTPLVERLREALNRDSELSKSPELDRD
jgi:hypothetical protein